MEVASFSVPLIYGFLPVFPSQPLLPLCSEILHEMGRLYCLSELYFLWANIVCMQVCLCPCDTVGLRENKKVMARERLLLTAFFLFEHRLL